MKIYSGYKFLLFFFQNEFLECANLKKFDNQKFHIATPLLTSDGIPNDAYTKAKYTDRALPVCG